jgi:MYXO-CTERM domain-containing protein
MTKISTLRIAGKSAIIAALMGGSSIVSAQDAAAPAVAPAGPVAVAPAVTPPPAVRTLPTANDTVNPAAAQATEAEAAEKRVTRAATPAPTARAKVANRLAAARVAAAQADVAGSVEDNVDAAPLAVDAIEPAPAVIEEPTATAAPAETASVKDTSVSDDDMTLVGGIAAALAALGIGAAVLSRRRRHVGAEQAPVMTSERTFVAPRPIKEDPAFTPFATTSPAVAAAPMSSAATAVAEMPCERAAARTSAMTRPDVTVTDPLFSAPAPSVPITDPMFAPRNDVEIPITDPLFAKHDRFAGRGQVTPSQRDTERVN